MILVAQRRAAARQNVLTPCVPAGLPTWLRCTTQAGNGLQGALLGLRAEAVGHVDQVRYVVPEVVQQGLAAEARPSLRLHRLALLLLGVSTGIEAFHVGAIITFQG